MRMPTLGHRFFFFSGLRNIFLSWWHQAFYRKWHDTPPPPLSPSWRPLSPPSSCLLHLLISWVYPFVLILSFLLRSPSFLVFWHFFISHFFSRARLCKCLRSLGINSKEPIPLAYAGYCTGPPGRLAESIPGLHKPLQIRAVLSLSIELHLFFSVLPSSTHSYLWMGTLFFAFLFVLAVKSFLISFATFFNSCVHVLRSLSHTYSIWVLVFIWVPHST